MSHNHFEWSGLRELKEALQTLPRELADEANGIVLGAALRAEQRVRANYLAHRVTGALADSVEHRVMEVGTYGAGARVFSTSKYATWFEHGTAARHTSHGAFRGVMPPAPPMHQFVPVMEQERRLMYDQLVRLLQQHGLTVER